MARNNNRGDNRRGQRDLTRRTKKKPCALCQDKVQWVDYKDITLLRKFMSDRGKIRSRRVSGNCAQHQRAVALAIKTARELVLLPYTQRTMTERASARGRGQGADIIPIGTSLAPSAATSDLEDEDGYATLGADDLDEAEMATDDADSGASNETSDETSGHGPAEAGTAGVPAGGGREAAGPGGIDREEGLS
jgi:small subunit ribosomal protein S18